MQKPRSRLPTPITPSQWRSPPQGRYCGAGPHLHTHPGAPPTLFLGRGWGCWEEEAATPGPLEGGRVGWGDCTAGDPYSGQRLRRDTGGGPEKPGLHQITKEEGHRCTERGDSRRSSRVMTTWESPRLGSLEPWLWEGVGHRELSFLVPGPEAEPGEASRLGVLDMGSLGPQAPASSGPPRCSQQHPCLSPGLSSAKMPGPAKPAVPVRPPGDSPPPPPCSGSWKTWAQPEGRAVSRWVGGGLRQENRMDRVMLHPPARPTCPAHPCSFHHPPALGQGRHLHILLGMALPLWPRVPPNLLYQTSPLSFLLRCSIRSLGNSYRVPTRAPIVGQELCQALRMRRRTEAESVRRELSHDPGPRWSQNRPGT